MTKRIIYEGHVFTVEVDRVRLPGGGELNAEIIRHPGSVVIVPITEAGNVVLVRQYRPAIGRPAWELPAGSLKAGEDPRTAAVRECHEETGLVPDRIDRLGAFYPTPGYCDELMNFFRAGELRKPREDERAEQDEDEDIEAREFSLRELQQMIAAAEIIDLKTIAGLTLAGLDVR